jgi:hypothetical protein
VRGGVRGHLLEPGAGAALAVAAAGRGNAGPLQTLDQVVANLLELRHVGHMPLRPQQRMGWLAGLSRVGGIGGELGLELGDLAAKLPAPQPLVAANLGKLRVGGLRRGGRQIDFGRSLDGACGVDRAREIAGIDSGFPGALDGVGRQALQVRGVAGALGDERAEPVPRVDQAVLDQAAVHGACGVDVDAGPGRELADARKPVPRRELLARDQHS